MSSCILNIKFCSDIAKDIYQGGSSLSYQTPESSGFDLRAVEVVLPDGQRMSLSGMPYTLFPGSRVQVPCGISFAVERGYELQIRSRSGLAWKNGVFVLNSPGTIDSDYRGEIATILHNSGDAPFIINSGDRVSQAVVCPVIRASFVFVDVLDDTERSAGGFGSTGQN